MMQDVSELYAARAKLAGLPGLRGDLCAGPQVGHRLRGGHGDLDAFSADWSRHLGRKSEVITGVFVQETMTVAQTDNTIMINQRLVSKVWMTRVLSSYADMASHSSHRLQVCLLIG